MDESVPWHARAGHRLPHVLSVPILETHRSVRQVRNLRANGAFLCRADRSTNGNYVFDTLVQLQLQVRLLQFDKRIQVDSQIRRVLLARRNDHRKERVPNPKQYRRGAKSFVRDSDFHHWLPLLSRDRLLQTDQQNLRHVDSSPVNGQTSRNPTHH